MQLVGSPNKGCNLFGCHLNPRNSKYYTEKIFKHLGEIQNSINSLMTKDSLGRMDFLALKISEEIKVKVKINSCIVYMI